MDKKSIKFDETIEDFYAEEDLLFNVNRNSSLEFIPVHKISKMIEEECQPKSCLISLLDEPKVA